MESHGLIAITRKEFTDQLRSRNFLLIAGVLLLICTVGLIGGVTEYQDSLSAYNDRLSVAADDEMQGLMTDRPSVLSVFTSIGTPMSILGAILGIALGFDLVTKEKESKSLKLLLSHPIYRDEAINGKALGGSAALLLPLGAVLTVALALLLIVGIVPDPAESVLVLVFGAITALMILAYFSVALLMSTVARNSGTALVYSLIVFIAFTMLVPVAMNDTTMEIVIGDVPEIPSHLLSAPQSSPGETAESFSIDLESNEWQQYLEETKEYEEKRRAVNDVISLFSPSLNYEAALDLFGQDSWSAISVTTSDGRVAVRDLSDPASGASGVTGNILALIVYPAVFFGLAYSRFMRLDVR